MGMDYYSSEGKKVNTTTYPDYAETKYLNWNEKQSESETLPSLYCRKEDCCGCFACYSACPKKAIEMVEDLEGFVYPVINLDICIRCHKCESVCPLKHVEKTLKFLEDST